MTAFLSTDRISVDKMWTNGQKKRIQGHCKTQESA